MNIYPGALAGLSLAGFVLSLAIHLLTVTQVYLVPNFIIFVLTAGILMVWLSSSRLLKNMQSDHDMINAWKWVFSSAAAWLKYLTVFFIAYAVVNFAMSVSTQPAGGYIDLDVSQQKLRGLSGFWLAFYALGFLIGRGVGKYDLLRRSSDSEE